MNKYLIGFGVALALFVGGYFYLQSYVNRKVGRLLEDTVKTIQAKHAKELSDCFARYVEQRPPIQTPVIVKSLRLTREDSLRIAVLMGFVASRRDSAQDIVVRLTQPKYGEAEATFEDEQIKVKTFSYGSYNPLTSDTIAIGTMLTEFQLKQLPRDTVTLTVTNCKVPLIENIYVRGDLDFRWRDRNAGGISFNIPFNVEGFRVSPKVGYHSVIGAYTGVAFEYGLLP